MGNPAKVDRGQVSAWIAAMLDGGAQPTTAAARLAGVRQFSKWLAAEGEIDSDPLLRLNAPKGDVPITPVLTDDELRALIQGVSGADTSGPPRRGRRTVNGRDRHAGGRADRVRTGRC